MTAPRLILVGEHTEADDRTKHTPVVMLTSSQEERDVLDTYKLGNRSALEWVLDQYQVSADKRSGIVTDPNRADDPEYIVRLVRKVVTVSMETERLVASLPRLKKE